MQSKRNGEKITPPQKKNKNKKKPCQLQTFSMSMSEKTFESSGRRNLYICFRDTPPLRREKRIDFCLFVFLWVKWSILSKAAAEMSNTSRTVNLAALKSTGRSWLPLRLQLVDSVLYEDKTVWRLNLTKRAVLCYMNIDIGIDYIPKGFRRTDQKRSIVPEVLRV